MKKGIFVPRLFAVAVFCSGVPAGAEEFVYDEPLQIETNVSISDADTCVFNAEMTVSRTGSLSSAGEVRVGREADGKISVAGTWNSTGHVYLGCGSNGAVEIFDGGEWTSSGYVSVSETEGGNAAVSVSGAWDISAGVDVKAGGEIIVRSGGKVVVRPGGKIIVRPGGEISLFDGGELRLDSAKNFVIDASGYKDETLTLTLVSGVSRMLVAGTKVEGDNFIELLSGVSVVGYSEKSFSLQDDELSVTLTMPVPETSAFGLCAGAFALACVCSRRRRSRNFLREVNNTTQKACT